MSSFFEDRRRIGVAAVAAVITLIQSSRGAGSETESSAWPTFRGTAARSAYANASLEFPLAARWRHTPTASPRPAWPAPARGSYWQQLDRIEPRVVDDRTFHPVSDGRFVYFASSSDDSLTCLDGETGRERWRFVTDGPLRYAPVLHGDAVFVAGDDGAVYALHADDGRLLWKKRLHVDRRIVANQRVVSSHPVRTGLVVQGDQLFVAFGLFPSQGVWITSLSVNNGDERWRKATSHSLQGYLAIADQTCVAPMGRALPLALNVENGGEVGGFSGEPGAYIASVGDWLFTGRGNRGRISASHIASRTLLGTLPARHVAGSQETLYLLGEGFLTAIPRPRWDEFCADLMRNKQTFQAAAKRGDIWERLSEWRISCEADAALVCCRNAVVVAGEKQLVAFDPSSGEQVWSEATEQPCLSLAIAGDAVLAADATGSITSYQPGDHQLTPSSPNIDEPLSELPAKTLAQIKRGPQKGIAVVCGAEDGGLARAIAEHTELQVVVVERDRTTIETVRKNLRRWGVYGSRVTAHYVPDDQLPFTDYLANFVTSERAVLAGGPSGWDLAELQRIQRPWGGVLWLGGEPTVRGPLAGAGQWTHQYANAANTANSEDRWVRPELQLQWFGGPGPRRLPDRHLRSHSPLAAAGVLVVVGENQLIGVDAYNGFELWSLPTPGAHRYSIPYDSGYVAMNDRELAVAVGGECWIVDPQTGTRTRTLSVPKLAASDDESPTPLSFGYVGMPGSHLLVSLQAESASRTRPSRRLIDADYRNETPVVASQGIAAYASGADEPSWTHRDVVINATITVAENRVHFVASKSAKRDDATQPLHLPVLLKDAEYVTLDLHTGETLWRLPVEEHLAACRNIMYLQCDGGRLIASGSLLGEQRDSAYRLSVRDAATGRPSWRSEHAAGKPGAYSHGEQVHHPVIVGDKLLAEPAIYTIKDGRRISPRGDNGEWTIIRPGHSCGTMSAANGCVFFRAGNPTLFDMSSGAPDENRFHKLAPSRPGCWINIIPACGLVLIPEASASCVCAYPLQTSMAFLPKQPETAKEK